MHAIRSDVIDRLTVEPVRLPVEEHPRIVVRDVLARPRAPAHVLVFANEKGGVGKSTLAFHCAVALADRGHRVAALDLDGRQQTLERSLVNRESTARTLGIPLPQPRHVSVRQQSGAMLTQEIARIAQGCDYVIIDAAGHDSPLSRRALALADTLVTPVNSSFVDLDLLARFRGDQVTIREAGCFAQTVNALREERAGYRRAAVDWVLVPNRLRPGLSQNQFRFEAALALLPDAIGCRIARGLTERVVFRELFPLGLTSLDLHRLPEAARRNTAAERELDQLLEDLALPLSAPLARSA